MSSARLLSIGQAAHLLEVSIDTLRNWEEQGKISPIRTAGGVRRYKLSELLRLQKSHPRLSKKLAADHQKNDGGTNLDLINNPHFTSPQNGWEKANAIINQNHFRRLKKQNPSVIDSFHSSLLTSAKPHI